MQRRLSRGLPILVTPRLGFRHTFIFNRKSLAALMISSLLLILVGAWRIKNQAQLQLDAERERERRQSIVPFERKTNAHLTRKGLEILQNFSDTRAITRFQDSLFAATDGGLVAFSQSGQLTRHYSAIDGLPESDLVSLAAFDSKLFLGTRTRGLVSFDGQTFESYRWTDRDAQSVNSLLEDEGRLLIGTMAGGLIEFDGQQFKEITAGREHTRLLHINYLRKSGQRLFVGTFDDGLWVEEGERWFHFTTAQGLPSNRIVGVAETRAFIFVASDYGLSVAPNTCFSNESSQSSSACFQTVGVMPTLSSMIETRAGVLLCEDDGETFTLAADNSSSRVNPLAWAKPSEMTGCRLVALNDSIFMLSSRGIMRADADALAAGNRGSRSQFAPFGQSPESHHLASNLISALLIDDEGRLWAGSFRDGITILSADGSAVARFQTEAAREINSLVEEPNSRTVLASTSQGLLRFDERLRQTASWSTRDGLLSNSVMQAAFVPEAPANETVEENHARNFRLACATSKGLSLGALGHLRGLTTTQGLPSNSLYTVFTQGRRVYAGTLGGLAVIEDGRVVRVLTDTNSSLTHNWVTAIALAGGRLFVGTYGGGIFELTASGELHSFAAETGRAVINPNAMWSDGERLYAGTLDGALVLDLQTQKWTHMMDELPSRTVLSVAGDTGQVCFGTTGGIARFKRSYWNQAEATEDESR